MAAYIDIGIVILYLLAVLAFGYSFYRKDKTAKSFTRGEGKLPAWALGMSVFATYVSSISFLALPGNAFAKDWSNYVFSLSIPLAAFIAVRFFVPVYRKLDSDSAYAFMEQRFGPWARKYASACYLLTQLARMGAILYLLALPVHSLTGLSVPFVISVTGLLVLIYASLGGIKAVVYTDAIQGFILIIGALLCLFSIIGGIDGGWFGFMEEATKADKMNLGSLKPDWKESSFWLILVYGLFINLQNFGVDQSYIQRYMGARTEKDAARSVWMGALLYVPVSLLFFLIGTALWVHYKQMGMAVDFPADQVLPFYIVNELPVGIKGILIAAILSAGMSTVSTSVNSSATVLLSDFFQGKSRSDGESLKLLRILSAAMAALSIWVAFAFLGVNSALDVWWALASIFSGGILGLFLLGLLSKGTGSAGAILAVAIGVLFVIWTSLSQLLPHLSLSFGLHPNFVIVIATMIILILGWLFGQFKSKS